MAEAFLWVLNRFLHEHKSLLGALANMTAQQLGWSGRSVVSVTPDTCAMVACSLMAEKNIAGIGVVSQSGALIGNFSYSDLRCSACLNTNETCIFFYVTQPSVFVHMTTSALMRDL